MAGRCPFHALSPANGSTAHASSDQPPPEPLSVALKRLTQAQHDEAEHHGFHRLLMGPDTDRGVSLSLYRHQLGQMFCIHRVLEPMLRAGRGGWARMGLDIADEHLHLARLEDDLRWLGVEPWESRPLPATERFIRFLAGCASGDGVALVGVFYVFEGSTNGGTIIAKRLRDLHGWADDRGTRFTNPHGPQVRARWMHIKQGLDGLPLDQHQRARVIDAARATFRGMSEIMSELAGRGAPAGV